MTPLLGILQFLTLVACCSLTTVGRMQSVGQESSGNPTPGSRPPSAVVAGDGTAPPLGDKELNDLLDFSAVGCLAKIHSMCTHTAEHMHLITSSV